MTAKIPDLNELFNPVRNTHENLRYSTDFTRELLAEFDIQHKKMHQELELQRKALESGKSLPDEQVLMEHTSDKHNENIGVLSAKPIAPVQERKTGHKLKTIRQNILHIWRNHEIPTKDKIANSHRSKSCNAAEKLGDSRDKIDRRSIFGTWRNFSFTTCTEDTSI